MPVGQAGRNACHILGGVGQGRGREVGEGVVVDSWTYLDGCKARVGPRNLEVCKHAGAQQQHDVEEEPQKVTDLPVGSEKCEIRGRQE